MATIWLTYAWEDNRSQDVDFVAQELVAAGLEVKLDRWNIAAGKRLWEQIESFIQDPRQSDAWVLYATQASLGSEPCKEEFAYALDRALKVRGGNFPVIGLFPSTVDNSLIPAAIRTRLYVSTRDPDWKERVKSAAERRDVQITRPGVSPYELREHRGHEPGSIVFEVRPRAGTWAPFIAAIPNAEQAAVGLYIMKGPSGRVTTGGSLSMCGEGTSADGKWYFCFAGDEATPTTSYYLFLKSRPSTLVFGVQDGVQYQVSLK